MQVLRRDMVKRAVVAALQERPNGFNAIRMCHSADILRYRMVDRLMRVVVHAGISLRFVRVELRTGYHVVAMKPCSVVLSVRATTMAVTLLVSRSRMPATAVLPTGSRPMSFMVLRLALDMFLRLPPK